MNARRQILIIDDDQDIREVIRISLQTIADWDVLTAASGQEGVLIAQSEQPDAILLDVILPDVSGIDIYQRIRKDSKIQHIPVILLTARLQIIDRLEFSKLPIAGVIRKPFKATTLIQEMRSILNWYS